MNLQEHENEVLNAIDRAISALDADDLREFWDTVTNHIAENRDGDGE